MIHYHHLLYNILLVFVEFTTLEELRLNHCVVNHCWLYRYIQWVRLVLHFVSQVEQILVKG